MSRALSSKVSRILCGFVIRVYFRCLLCYLPCVRKLTSILGIAPILLANGCLFQIVHDYPSAQGRVIDARTGQPVPGAEVTRQLGSVRTNGTITDVQGRFHFHGQRGVQIWFGDHVPEVPQYRISAPGYESLETNGYPTKTFVGLGHRGPAKHNLGEIRLNPTQ
jgi:hypothetical protein